MNILIPIFIITMILSCASPAPSDRLHQFELSMLNKLNKPWFSTPKPSQFPRKGEYPCRGGICRARIRCEGCAKPSYGL